MTIRGPYHNQYVTGRIVHEMWTHDGVLRAIVLDNNGQHVRATISGADPAKSMLNARVHQVDGRWELADESRRAAA